MKEVNCRTELSSFTRRGGYEPPFCPNPGCRHHLRPNEPNWWNNLQPYETQAFGRVPRYYCRSCGKTFSVQTFRVDYYCKRVVDYRMLHHLSSESMSVRGLSRYLGVSPGCVINRSQRLGRQCIAMQNMCRTLIRGGEEVAIDGFASFDVSQYYPNNITLSVTGESLFVLEASHATMRRSGRMNERQKARRGEQEKRWKGERGGVSRSFREVLDQLAEGYPRKWGEPLVIWTDEKVEYGRVFRKHDLYRNQNEERRCVHGRISSREARTRLNPLFPCNYMDREIRKDQAAHRRETACHCRNVNNGMLRLWCYVGWHNYWKEYPIDGPAGERLTHAEWAGINGRLLSWIRSHIYETRVFLSRIRLSACCERAWLLDHRTPLKTIHDYVPAYVAR